MVRGAAVAACGPPGLTEAGVRRFGVPVNGRAGTSPGPLCGRGPTVADAAGSPPPPGLITAYAPCSPVIDRAVRIPRLGSAGDRRPGAAVPNRVLVVDDDPALDGVLLHTMDRCGYAVTVTANPTDAVTELRTGPDVLAVSSHLKTARMTGVEFGVHLLHLSGVPVLFLMSGPAPIGLLDNPLIGVINKPMQMSDLRDRLEELLTRRTTTAATPVSRCSSDASADSRCCPAGGGHSRGGLPYSPPAL